MQGCVCVCVLRKDYVQSTQPEPGTDQVFINDGQEY